MASLLVHALAAYLLFSLATSSSEQTAPESFSGAVMVSVTRAVPKKSAPVSAAHAAVPIPHATVVPHPRAAAQPRSAPPHPRVLHELAKFAPTAPPNPTPAPVSSSAPNPLPTQAQLAVTPAPLPASVPTTAPASVAAVSIRIPPTAAPTAAPSPKPKAVPTALPSVAPKPTAAPATPLPEPSALIATAAPLIAVATPQPLVSPGSPSQVKLAQAQPAATPAHANAPSPGPKPAASAGPKSVASPGPRGIAPVKGPPAARPIQAPPATPHPAPVHPSKRAESLNQRLQSLIPTAAPSTASPAPAKHYSFLNIKSTPEPEPTPPPDVLAATKYLYVENIAGQKWKHWPLGAAPEELAVKMYVTSIKRIGPITWCTGWVLRYPMNSTDRGGYTVDSDRDLTPKPVIEPNASFICSGHLEPFTPPTPEPPAGS